MTALIARLADAIANCIQAIEQLTVTTLRNVIGRIALEKTLTSRDHINTQLRGVLDAATRKWEVRVNRVDLKAIDPPASIPESMEKQTRAAAGRRSLVSLPTAGSPHRSPRLARAASAEPSRESRAAQRSDNQLRVDGAPKPRLRGVSHQVAFVAAVPGAVAVALTTSGVLARAAGTGFAVSVAATFGVSSIFHRGSWTPAASRRLRRLDHAMIYGLIAGTYAPIGLLVLDRGWRVPILAMVWGGACLATAVRFLWEKPPVWLTPALGIALGWTAVVALPQIVGRIGFGGALLLVVGGLAYTAGALVYVRRSPNPAPATFGYHELFHALVIVAVACQYSTIVFYVLPRT
jgi:hemolysin III